jgi:hypothetical protein
MSEILILGEKPEGMAINKKVKFFEEELDLVSYLSSRLEDKALILLEIPLPEIIESYIW